MRRTACLAALVGLAAAFFVWQYYHFRPRFWSDLDQLWLLGHALRAGLNPYDAVPQYFVWPLYYPLSAMVVGLPLSLVPLWLARGAFAFLSASVATYAVLRYRPLAWPLLASGPFLHALQRGQWSPLMLAACFLPAWGVLVAVKPSTGLAPVVYRPDLRALLAAALLVLASLLLRPHWPVDWLHSLSGQRHLRAPLLLPGGFLLALAALKWRRPEARLLLAIAIAPQTVVPYDLVPLAVVPESRREVLLVAVGWMVVYIVQVALAPISIAAYVQFPTHGYLPRGWYVMLVAGYLVPLALVLRRPNVSRSRSPSPAALPASSSPG